MKIFPTDKNIKDKKFMEMLYKLPFNYYKSNNIIKDLRSRVENWESTYSDYLDYFQNQWLPYFYNGMLNYIYLDKEQRSNSYIENYNRRIKLKLSKYLYGKNHCKISWPLFLFFIKKEEEDSRMQIYETEKDLVIKGVKVRKFKKVKKIKNFEGKNLNEEKIKDKKEVNNIFDDNNYLNENKKWFKWNKNSCRYDSFSLLYALIIKPIFDTYKETPQNYIINYLNNLFGNCIYLSNTEFKNGFWTYLKKHKDINVDLTTNIMCFEKKGSLYQILDLLRCNNFFML